MLVDCHCHLLPDLDDGAQSLDEALALARQEVASGVTHAVVTPHGSSRNLQQTLQLRDQRLAELRQALQRENIPLELIPGLEYYADGKGAIEAIDEPGCRCGYPDVPQRPLLVELPMSLDITFAANLLFTMQLKHVTLILAHPERYRGFATHFSDLIDLLWKGMYLQFNVSSFQRSLRHWLTRRVIFKLLAAAPEQILIGSDAHHSELRPAGLALAQQAITDVFDDDTWELVSYRNAQTIHLVP